MKPTSYQVTDCQTRAVVATFKSRGRASAYCDRKDMEYGAVRYVARPVWEA